MPSPEESTLLVARAIPSGTGSLPTDLLASASRRLQWVSLIYGAGFLIVYAIFLLTIPGFGQRETFRVEAFTAGASALLALGVFATARSRRLSPLSLIDLGFLFEVAGGFGISMAEYWGIFGGGTTKIFGISWICVWIIMFPLVVPGTPAKSLLAAIATASTGVLAYTLSVAFYGTPPQPFSVLVPLFVPSYFCTLVAFLAAKVIYKLSADVRDARRMGAYELVERLGAGGMGEVWRAEHRFLSRPAAIKLVKPEVLGGSQEFRSLELRKRFEREAEATSALRSPHSIVLYDFGVTDAGVFYYVMELLDGIDLQSLVRRFGPLPASRVVFLLRQVCHSLIDAHAKALVHRDVKPANIYLCRMGNDHDFVKVLDFGLVRSTADSADPWVSSTQGVVAGTPGYIAPEVILGGTSADPRVDIYAVGCVAYWMLTGTLVFVGDTPAQLLRQHLNTEPRRPSECSELEIPRLLDDVVIACLAKDPAKRVQSALELDRMLERCCAPGEWTLEDARHWWDLHLPPGATCPPDSSRTSVQTDSWLSGPSLPQSQDDLRRPAQVIKP